MCCQVGGEQQQCPFRSGNTVEGESPTEFGILSDSSFVGSLGCSLGVYLFIAVYNVGCIEGVVSDNS